MFIEAFKLENINFIIINLFKKFIYALANDVYNKNYHVFILQINFLMFKDGV